MRYEELKTPLKLCTGARKGGGQQCSGTLHKCGACGAIGCKQNREDMCSEQVFNVLGGCLKCGATGKMETLPPGDYKTQQKWHNPPTAASAE
jgi:hypothetical protein